MTSHTLTASDRMRKYASFFRIRFTAGLQYRAAALAGMVTQFAWGFMNILMFAAFYRTNPAAVPMPMEQLTSYLWVRQALLALLASYMVDNDMFRSVVDGNVAVELCRPCDLYWMWYVKNAALRVSRCVLRCVPILAVAFLLPESLRLRPPPDLATAGLFLLSLALGFAVILACTMFIYLSAFYTVSPIGVRIIIVTAIDFFSGSYIPLNFFPARLRTILELLPFSATNNVPLRIYSGNIAGEEAVRHILLQLFWLVVMTALGKWVAGRAIRRTVIQGG